MHRQIFQNIISLLCLGFVFFSCKKDKPNAVNTSLPKDSSAKVLIVCEGSLGNGNATLSVYQALKDSLFNDVYKNANGQDLGDVFQSINKINNQYFLCINNSDKIVVLDANNWKQKANINILKPRYILDIGNNKAYVGSLFNNKIYVLNTQTYTIEKEIIMPYQNTEGMILKNGIAYACCWDTACNKLYAINVITHSISDSIVLKGNAPQSMVIDKENQLWVMGGNVYKNKNAHLNRIDLSTQKVSQFFLFDKGVEALKPTLNLKADTLYFLEVNYGGSAPHNGVYRMSVSDKKLPSTAFIPCQTNQYFWALGINPNDGHLYIGDPKGFVQKSSVYIYNQQAQLKSQFNVGLGVGSFYFD